MGEYATFQGEEIKIGTCESMYYLRADQKAAVSGYEFDGTERFRFPFPDEDDIAPGRFEDYERGVQIPGWTLPAHFREHGSVQLSSQVGYLLSIPCPEQFGQPGFSVDMPDGVRVHRNGFHGHPVVRQQRYFDGRLVTVVACGACSGAWRLETKADAAPVAEAFLNEAEREEYRSDLGGFGRAHNEKEARFLMEMASRILDGYEQKASV